MLKSRTGAQMRHVPYRGTAPALTDLVAGTLDLMIDSMASAIGQIEGGNVVPVAVCGPTRNPRLPNVPTMTEAGIKDYNAVAWLALFAPKGTPAAIVATLDAAVKTSLDKPDVMQARRRRPGSMPTIGRHPTWPGGSPKIRSSGRR